MRIYTVVMLFFLHCSIFSEEVVHEISVQESSLIFDLFFDELKERDRSLKGLELIQKDQVPKHVAILADGNRRWAIKNKLPTSEGHWRGANNLKRVMKIAAQLGVKTFTFGAFSKENLSKRSPEEVEEWMKIMDYYIKEVKSSFLKSSICVKTIGDLSILPLYLQNSIEDLKQETSASSDFTVVVAINYSGRDELRRAITKIASDLENKVLQKEDITEELVESYLDTAGIDSPDLLIRTGGETRLSNFGPWQIYTELYFSPVLWPDFTEQNFLDAILDYQERSRRLGS